MRFNYQKKISKEHDNVELQTFGEHLDVLRKMLFRISALSIVIAFFVFSAKNKIFNLLLAPCSSDFVTFNAINKFFELIGSSIRIYDSSLELIATDLPSQFLAHISISFYIGILFSSPYILYELFRFISPALYENEKRYSFRIMVAIYTLFVLGLLTSYFLLFPISYRFLASYSVSENVKTMITLDSYISTFISLTLLMGIVFQLPILTFFLSKIGTINSTIMKEYRKHAFVLILVVAAIITPPDVMTLILVSFPLYMLYELSIIVAKFTEK